MEGVMDEDPEPRQVQKMEVEEDGDDEVGGGDISELEPTTGIEMDTSTPSVEQLLEEIRLLKTTVEEQRESLGKMEELKKKYRKLKRRLKTTQQMFKNKWKGMRMEMAGLREEEGQLVEEVETLKKTLDLRNTAVGSKLEEIRELTRKADALKSGKVKKSTSLKPVEEVIGEKELARGRRAAVDILPEEVWKIIFGNVSDPNDLWNLCNTCQLFNIILSPWKTGWMLGQALPYLYHHLPGNKLLESRLVCRSWKGAVDHFLEEHPSLRPHDLETNQPRPLDFVNPMKDKGLGEEYSLIMDNTSHMSMFDYPWFVEKWKPKKMIGRSFTLDLGGDFDEDDYDVDEGDPEEKAGSSRPVPPEHTFEQMWENLYVFLNGFGKEIWYLNVQYSPTHVDAGKWDRKIRQFLALDLFQIFPNLRKLYVWYGELGLEPTINPQSLPPAKHLETFEIPCWDGKVADAMLTKHHAQLRRLLCNALSWETANPLTWPNLTELHLFGFGRGEYFPRLFDGLRLPQLTKLGLNLEDLTGNNGAEFRSLLRMLRGLSARTRLNTLRLEGGLLGFHPGQFEGSCYSLGKVKTLEFNHYSEGDSAPSYDFLLTLFPLLENLNVFVRQDFKVPAYLNGGTMGLLAGGECEKMKKPLGLGKEVEIVEVNKYIYDGEMYKSNIWELMPLLKVFSFQWDVYTRHEYEAYKEKLMEEKQKDGN